MNINPMLFMALAGMGAGAGAAGAGASAAGAAPASEAASALGATELAPEAAAAVEGGSGMSSILAKLGGGNEKLGELALANMAVHAGSAIAGDNSAMGRLGGAISKGMQGSMMAQANLMTQAKNQKIIQQILAGMTPPGQAGHDEFKTSSDGTYQIRGQLDTQPPATGTEGINPPAQATSANTILDNSTQVSSLSPWVQKITA